MFKNKKKRTKSVSSRVLTEAIEPRLLMSAGSLDPSFGARGEVVTTKTQNAYISGGFSLLAVDASNGNALMGGQTEVSDTIGNGVLEELNASGTLNSSFGNGGVLNPILPTTLTPFFQASRAVIQPDHKILIIGYSTSAYTLSIARLNANGTPDTTFGSGGIEALPTQYDRPTALALQSNGDILIAGDLYQQGYDGGPAVIYRLNPNGTLDAAFGTNGTAELSVAGADTSSITSITSDASGRIVASGDAGLSPYVGYSDVGVVARFTNEGLVDTSFNGTGYALELHAGDTIGSEEVQSTPVIALAVEPDGSIFTANSSGFVDNTANTILFNRINSDGTPDTSFGTGGQITSNIVIGVPYNSLPVAGVAQSDGKIVLATDVETNQDYFTESYQLIRINSDGSIDSTFGNGGYVTGTATSAINGSPLLDASNRLYLSITGTFYGGLTAGTFASGQTSSSFDAVPARFNPSGSLDTTYGEAGVAIGIPNFLSAEATAVLPNGQTLVAGEIQIGNQTGVYVQRFNNDGSLDTTFAPNAGLGGASGYAYLGLFGQPLNSAAHGIGIAVDSSGRVIVGANINSATFFRLNSNGTVDTTFGTNGVSTPSINGAALQLEQFVLDSSNRILFTAAGAKIPVVRLTADGAVDTTFGTSGEALADPPKSYAYQTSSLAIAANGQIYVGESSWANQGSNSTFAPQLAVARLNSNGTIDTTFGASGLAVAPLHYSNNKAAVTAVAVLSNGDVVAAGPETYTATGGESFDVARFLPSGKLDTSFGSNGQFISELNPIALQTETVAALDVESDGKLLISGTYLYYGHAETQQFYAARLTANGTLDSSFGSAGLMYTKLSNTGFPDTSLLSATITPDNDLQVAGDFDTGFALIRYELAVPIAFGSVSGLVYNDTNGDGSQETGENGLAGVTVYADLNNTGTYQAGDPSTTTNSSGNYVLTNVPLGAVIIREVLPAGDRQSYPAQSAGQHVTVGSTPITGINCGVTNRAYIAGSVDVYGGSGLANVTVYADLNNDGIYENGENAKVTAADGSFAFSGLAAGTYYLRVVLPAGYTYESPAGNQAIPVTVSSGGVVSNIVFTVQAQAAVPLTGTIIGTAGSYENDGNTVAKAFDGVLTNYFDGPTANGDYAGLNFGKPEVITRIAYDPRAGFASRMVGGIFQGSNSANFSGAVNLYTITSAPPSDTLTTVSIGNTSAFQYVRYLAPNGSYGDVGELAFYGYAPTHTQLTGTVIGTSGSYQNQGSTIANVFDGNLNTFFDAPTASGSWVGLDLGTAQVVTQVAYAPRSGWANRMVGGEIQASNSANFSSGAVTLYTITAAPTTGVLTTQILTNTTAYRYYRYIGPADSYCNIAELEFEA